MADKDLLQQLFQPLTVRSLTMPNRFAMAPMTRQASPGGIPGRDVAEYYRRRAAGGVGLIITEGIRLPDPAAGYPFSVPTIAGDEVLAGWTRVVDAVHSEGATIAAQLWHQGVQRDDADGVVPVGPSGVDGRGQPRGRALRTEELHGIAGLYAHSAAAARDIGFDAVEIHGAHGYLLDEFLWERTNQRTDAYGGSLAARTRFPAEVVAAVRAAVGPDYPVIFRFSQWKGTDYTASIADDPTQLQELLNPLVEAGVDVLHPSTRRHYVPAFPDYDADLSLAGWTKKVTGVPVIAVGSVGLETQFRSEKRGEVIAPAPVDRLVEQFEAGEFDVVAVGRALLADPTWVNRLRRDELDGFGGYDAAAALAGLA
ncbi:NADH:flavin oxidoreductase [Mycolicibacter sinensis]|jgi:2,4-dienoyl-CoA reductase-like NADH-dependent reductase (Old Yellow Enzyme family)|uniref:12-oxophytodienoate reductase n=1 Tax=Mycolicibacter sinensis (strain JDM601) TaxID=875328 RepID=A0A1A2E9I7_MYCSD|nr:NADH:flavin oxidoreductase [Mycolicibacter sinensis]OBG01782.1 12-oxophytodienoate reductase [Mycolicibacter sinensis]OBG10583.1 12-oxophytodienoate reductase [Mycolicibacter sinensis]